MHLYLIRHGKTAGNLLRQYIGRTDEPLCAQGIHRLQLLQEAGYYPDRPQKIYVSGMLRCRQTAAILWPEQQAVPVDALRECDFGRFEGKTYEQLQMDPDYRAWIGGESTNIPQGEDTMSFRKRCVCAFAKIAREISATPVSSVAMVLHGGSIMAVLQAYCGDALPPMSQQESFYRWQISNGAMISAQLTVQEDGTPVLTHCHQHSTPSFPD